MSATAAPDRVLRLQPSRRFWVAYAPMLLLAGLSIATLDISITLRVLLFGGLLIHPVWLRRRPRISFLRLLSDGRIGLGESAEQTSLYTVADASAGPWGCSVRCEAGHQHRRILVLPDAVTAGEFRYLVRWLRRPSARRVEGVSAPG